MYQKRFVLIAVSVKVAVKLQKDLSIAFYPESYTGVFMCFEIAQVYLGSAASRVYKGHLQSE